MCFTGSCSKLVYIYIYIYIFYRRKLERDEGQCSNTGCELYINEIETKISLHRVSCDDCDPHVYAYISR